MATTVHRRAELVADDCEKTGLGRVGHFHGFACLTFRRQSPDETIDLRQ
jgi:hypothetical protein